MIELYVGLSLSYGRWPLRYRILAQFAMSFCPRHQTVWIGTLEAGTNHIPWPPICKSWEGTSFRQWLHSMPSWIWQDIDANGLLAFYPFQYSLIASCAIHQLQFKPVECLTKTYPTAFSLTGSTPGQLLISPLQLLLISSPQPPWPMAVSIDRTSYMPQASWTRRGISSLSLNTLNYATRIFNLSWTKRSVSCYVCI